VVEEVYYQNVRLPPGEPFTKTWVVRNTGRCTWQRGVHLRRVAGVGPPLGPPATEVIIDRPVAPDSAVAVSVPMRTPPTPGTYSESWGLVDSANQPIAIRPSRGLVAQVVVNDGNGHVCDPGSATAFLRGKSQLDNTEVSAGGRFVQRFSVLNPGACTWAPGSRLLPSTTSPRRLSELAEVPLPLAIRPGQTFTIAVPMRAPAESGLYAEELDIIDGAGHLVDIQNAGVLATRIIVPPLPRCTGDVVARFISETVPDDSPVPAGEDFRKEWTVLNAGTCAWDARLRLERVPTTGPRLGLGPDTIPVEGLVLPGGTYTFEVSMRAPRAPGIYREDWQLRLLWGAPVNVSNSRTMWAKIVVAR
jgi:hypothetical protein